MPIKTRNMAGLQKWEETDDYIIHLDKDAVMTTVESYVTGTYDLFLERKADIDGSMELLKINDIEWTSEDDSKLILDINKAQLERIANTPTTMEEEDAVPQTFTTRAVPTTYEACFRVDKSSGEIYIGEGYENLWKLQNVKEFDYTSVSSDGLTCIITAKDNGDANNYGFGYEEKILGNSINHISAYIVDVKGEWLHARGSITMDQIPLTNDLELSRTFDFTNLTDWRARNKFYVKNTLVEGQVLTIKNIQITKTSTPKPFVKSIMPSGKLAFVTRATSETHTTLIKGTKFNTNTSDSLFVVQTGFPVYSYERFFTSNSYKNEVLDFGISKNTYKNITKNINLSTRNIGISGGFLGVGYQGDGSGKYSEYAESFKQLLIYDGNLTEAELIAENEKDIKLR